ncbi:DNA-binding Lrp family transcriptional regulator [Desulfobaculum xiamenense]|uniref:siroheme decarboxylase n=1 Tax=Desulfobaculum xiamenense TaxID=995050 RepID=A0A846QH51_9BACT|nr:AsnC family transcriptional regulator [Desulfobaculum xiamenense]NJB67608.1 DNA-binding Lrp family transcriptional regulator [Desulfobaculum xiamenense]
MDHFDKQILDIIQSGFPIEPRPYAVVGENIGLTESEVLARVRALKEQGVIRRIGGNFQSRELGWHSTLCAACVPQDKLDEFVAEVNAHPGVTHNYLRKHHYNIWFTFIGESEQIVADTLAAITRKTGIDILNLPADMMYKIKVDFKMNANGGDE